MKIYAPDYYKTFHCIASSCRHSCCIGWEIDVDEETYEYYKSTEGDFGKRLRDNISDGECKSFSLTEDERCPFLNREYLCDIIINLGEDSLCQICRDHPRYRNFFSDREEVGIGLCCEEAARIVVGKKEKTEIVLLEDDGKNDEPSDEEAAFFEYRSKLFDILQRRSEPIDTRLARCLALCGIEDKPKSHASLSKILLELEYMAPVWRDVLLRLGNAKDLPKLPECFDTALEQLAVYFLFRHLADSQSDGLLPERVAFCVLCTRAIGYICALWLSENGRLTLEDIAEAARMFSSEIEYSMENTEALISMT